MKERKKERLKYVGGYQEMILLQLKNTWTEI
jgi:hypothetical protein